MIELIRKHYGKLGMSFALVMLVINFYQHKELNKLRTEINKPQVVVGGDIQKAEVIDSLQSELFNAQNINGRYELSLDHLKEVNPKAANEFETFMNTQTE